MFFIHNALEKFKDVTLTGYFRFCRLGNPRHENHIIIVFHRFR